MPSSARAEKLTVAGRELLTEGRHLLRAADKLEARVKRVAIGASGEGPASVGYLPQCLAAAAAARR